jgi:thioredoxin 1
MVEFYSSRCPHCQAMEPIVDSLAQRFVGQAHVGKVNVDQETTLAATYRIDLIPTFVVFKDGREVSRLVGETTEETLAALLRAALVG